MTRIRIQKQRKTRRRDSDVLEPLRETSCGASELLESVEDLLEEIDRTLRSAG
jgi:hypothetical protein